MAEYADEMDDLVPFEVGLQANQTVLMWAGGILFWILSLLFMGFVMGFKEISAFCWITFFLGGLFLIVSQFVSRYNPIRTTRIPITGIILWTWSIFLAGFILWKGWSVYLGSNWFYFLIAYSLITLVITGGLLVANFLTSLKILNWMSLDMAAFLYTIGVVTMIIGIIHAGFNNKALLDIETLSFGDWALLFLFSTSFIIMLEMFHGAHRFNDIIKYAEGMAHGEFSMTPVVNNYYIMGSILMLIIGGIMLFIMVTYFFWYWIQKIFFEQLGDSLMVNSVYSLVFVIAAFFIPVWIVLILWTEYKNRKEETEEDEVRRKREKSEKLGVY
ncbi:MAG: hypothetical protein U9R75_08340 [Candidatus Thermoplasmatota archaeon]|nr:hypothetical protein [Candidatus Thermoplasmatota archaeon]